MKHAVTSKRVISYRGEQGGLHYRVVQSTPHLICLLVLIRFLITWSSLIWRLCVLFHNKWELSHSHSLPFVVLALYCMCLTFVSLPQICLLECTTWKWKFLSQVSAKISLYLIKITSTRIFHDSGIAWVPRRDRPHFYFISRRFHSCLSALFSFSAFLSWFTNTELTKDPAHAPLSGNLGSDQRVIKRIRVSCNYRPLFANEGNEGGS